MGQHVLVPVDGSDRSEKALRYALENLQDPRITVVHVVNPANSFGYADDEYFDYQAYQRQSELQHERGETLLAEARETAEAEGVTVETVLEVGRPARSILSVAEDRDVDHIVMGSRGRSGVGRVIFGSVAETVTRRAAVPVTIVR